jgi:hypothetical protein
MAARQLLRQPGVNQEGIAQVGAPRGGIQRALGRGVAPALQAVGLGGQIQRLRQPPGQLPGLVVAPLAQAPGDSGTGSTRSGRAVACQRRASGPIKVCASTPASSGAWANLKRAISRSQGNA